MAQADMHDKICIVTGSTSGIGKATALGLAKLGATVVMVARDKDRGEATRSEIQTKSGKYFIKRKEARSSKETYDEVAQQRLWQICAELTKLDS